MFVICLVTNEVSKYCCIIVCPTANTTADSDCLTPGDEPEQGTDRYGEKDFEKKEGFKRKVEKGRRNVNNRFRNRT